MTGAREYAASAVPLPSLGLFVWFEMAGLGSSVKAGDGRMGWLLLVARG